MEKAAYSLHREWPLTGAPVETQQEVLETKAGGGHEEHLIATLWVTGSCKSGAWEDGGKAPKRPAVQALHAVHAVN